jgi:DNA-binding CsgD family transcriptional regulator
LHFDPNGWSDVLESCAQFIGGDTAILHVGPRHSREARKLITSAGCNFDNERYLSYYEARSPLIAQYRDVAVGEVRALGYFAFSPAYRRSEYYYDWVRPQGWADMIGSHLVRTPDLYAWLSIRRAERRRTYTSREIRSAARIASHLGRAIKLRFHVERECSATSHLRDSLQFVGFGILVVDVSGRVLIANCAAEAILKRGRGLTCRRGALVCDRPRENAALHAAIQAATQPLCEIQPTAADLHVTGDAIQRPLAVHVAAMPSVSSCDGFAPSTAAAVVFVIDPEADVDDFDGMAAAYSLTAGERRVLREIVKCEGLVRAAEKLRISLPTARTHLQNIFAKTDTNSQAEVVRLALTSSFAGILRRPER